MARNFLTRSRHGTIYYFRRRVPDDLRQLIGKSFLHKSLATAHRGTATIVARSYATRTDALYESLRDMKKQKTDGLRTDYTFKIDLDSLGNPSSYTFDAQPEEQEAVNSHIKTIIESSSARRSDGPPKADAKTFETAIAEYLKRASGKPQTKATYLSKFSHAQEFFGGKETDILKLDQTDLVRYSEHVLTTIGHVTTQSHYISVVAAFLNWHRTRSAGLGLLTTKTLIPKKDTPEGDDRDAYSLIELGQVFLNASKYRNTNPSKFWATVATAFLGCRIEELCQIYIDTDVVLDGEVNVWYLTFNAKPDPDGVVRKSMKKPTSWRRVPVHSTLVKYGFIDFLQGQAKKGIQRPFQGEWKPREILSNVGQIIKWSHYISRWGGRELDAVAASNHFDPTHNIAYFHSMRHTFKVILGEAGVSTELSEALAGRRYADADAERYEKLKQNHRRLSTEGIERGLDPLSKLLEEALPV